jgi:hypothetical protein
LLSLSSARRQAQIRALSDRRTLLFPWRSPRRLNFVRPAAVAALVVVELAAAVPVAVEPAVAVPVVVEPAAAVPVVVEPAVAALAAVEPAVVALVVAEPEAAEQEPEAAEQEPEPEEVARGQVLVVAPPAVPRLRAGRVVLAIWAVPLAPASPQAQARAVLEQPTGPHPTGRQPAAGTPGGTMEPEHSRKGLAPIPCAPSTSIAIATAPRPIA